MRAYEFIGEAQNTEKPHWLGIPLRQLHDMKLKYKRDMAALRQRQQLIGRMYKSNADIEQELEMFFMTCRNSGLTGSLGLNG